MYTIKRYEPKVERYLPDHIRKYVQIEADGSVTFVGNGFTFDGSQGTTGQFLTSQGVGATPEWTTNPATIGGSGTTGKLAKFTAALTIGNSIVSESGTNLTIGGDVVAGAWKGALVGTAWGGTGQDFSTKPWGGIVFFSAVGSMESLTPGTVGYILSTNGAGADPGWISVAGAGGVTGTGTASKVARWTSGTNIGNAALSDDATNAWLPSGKFGIGQDPSADFNFTQKYSFPATFTNASGDYAAMWRNGTPVNVFGIAARTTTPGVFLSTNNGYDLWLLVDGDTARSIKIAQATGIVTIGKQLSLTGKLYPATDAAALQTATGIYGNTGAPNNANGANGDFYFRADGGALTTIYQRRAGAWVGVV